MQPTLVLTAPNPGIVYINGHFAGEISKNQPLIRPVAARGALYLDFRPLEDSCRPLARKLVFSGGEVLPESAEEAGNLNIILWPGAVTELEIAPEPWDVPQRHFAHSGMNFLLESGAKPKIYCEGRLLGSVPEGAEIPTFHAAGGAAALLGRCRDGMFLITADREFRSQTGFLQAQEIEIAPTGEIRALLPAGDPSGHAIREIWQLSAAGLRLLSSEPTWLEGVPKYPQNIEETAISAVESARSGMIEYAENYLTPRLRARHPLEEIVDRCDLCVLLKYTPPNPQPAVGFLHFITENYARVELVSVRAVASDNGKIPWLIDDFA